MFFNLEKQNLTIRENMKLFTIFFSALSTTFFFTFRNNLMKILNEHLIHIKTDIPA